MKSMYSTGLVIKKRGRAIVVKIVGRVEQMSTIISGRWGKLTPAFRTSTKLTSPHFDIFSKKSKILSYFGFHFCALLLSTFIKVSSVLYAISVLIILFVIKYSKSKQSIPIQYKGNFL